MPQQAQIEFDKVQSVECPSCKAAVDVSSFEPFDETQCPSCGASVTVPGRLGAYRLLGCLGSGGMGSVYRAYDETLARIVAIKVMLRSLGEKPEFLESFRREAQAAAKLNHPNIAQIYSFGEEKGQPYIVMELVGGRHFDEMIASPEPLDQAMVMKIGMDIADGLQLAAASNLVHGDIKPENIILDERNSAKLLDFGIASSPDSQSTEIWGTPYYIAPEKLRRQRADFRSDIYCLGGTLYHALTQHPPFEGEDAMAVVKARLERPPEPMSKWRPDIDPEVEEIVSRMLQADPAMRYPTYGSLISDMRRYLSRVQPKASAASGPSSKRIVIKGRGRSAPPHSDAAPTASHPPTIHGTKPKIAVSRGMVDARTTTSSHSSQRISGPIPYMQDEPSRANAESAPKGSSTGKKVFAGCMIGVGAIVLIALLGVGGLFYHLHSKAKQALGDYAAKVEARNARLAQFQALRTNSAKLRDETAAAFMTEASGIVSQALAVVVEEVGSEWTDQILFERPEEDDADKTAAAEADDDAAGDETAAEDGAAKEETAKDGAGADGAEPAAEAGAAAAEADKTADPNEGAVEEDITPLSSGEIVLEGLPGKAREIFLALAPVRAANKQAAATADRIEEIASGAEALARTIANEPPQSAVDAATVAAAATIVALDGSLATATTAYNETAHAINALPVAISKAKDLLRTLLEEAERLGAERRRKAEEERKAEEARKAEEERRAEEARIFAEKGAELEKIKMCLVTNFENIRTFHTDKAVRELKKLEEGFKYPESRKALSAAIKRVECVSGIKAFIIERCGAIHFEAPNGTWEIQSANERELEVRFNTGSNRGKTKAIKWADVSLKQMIPIISFYLDREDNAKTLRLRAHMDALRDAAGYYLAADPDGEKAKETAARYISEIVTRLPQRRKEMAELFPDLAFSAD